MSQRKFATIAARCLYASAVRQHRGGSMSKLLAIAALLVVVMACHSANDGKPTSDHVADRAAAPTSDPGRKVEEKDDDDDDRPSATGKQNPLPAAPTPAPAAAGAVH